jgi:hypothetical protein
VEATDDLEQKEHVCYQNHVIPNDEDDDNESQAPEDNNSVPILFRPTNETMRNSPSEETNDTPEEENLADQMPTQVPKPAHVIPDEETLTTKDPQAELLRWHY